MSAFGLLIILIFIIPLLLILSFFLNLVLRLFNLFRSTDKYSREKNKIKYDNFLINKVHEVFNDRREKGEKIISDNVGQYVDYEEVKEGN